MKQNWTKRPNIHVIVAETKCCGWWSHDATSKARPVHWDDKLKKYVPCKIKAYWRLEPVAKVKV